MGKKRAMGGGGGAADEDYSGPKAKQSRVIMANLSAQPTEALEQRERELKDELKVCNHALNITKREAGVSYGSNEVRACGTRRYRAEYNLHEVQRELLRRGRSEAHVAASDAVAKATAYGEPIPGPRVATTPNGKAAHTGLTLAEQLYQARMSTGDGSGSTAPAAAEHLCDFDDSGANFAGSQASADASWENASLPGSHPVATASLASAYNQWASALGLGCGGSMAAAFGQAGGSTPAAYGGSPPAAYSASAAGGQSVPRAFQKQGASSSGSSGGAGGSSSAGGSSVPAAFRKQGVQGMPAVPLANSRRAF